MKTINLFILLIAFSNLSFSQKIQFVGPGSSDKYDEISKRPITVVTGYDKETDAAIKFAFDKFWKFSTVKYMTIEEYNKSGKDEKSVFSIDRHFIRDYGTYSSTQINWVGQWKTNRPYLYQLPFDNLSKGENENIGTDKTNHDISNKAIQYVMMLNSQIKLLVELGWKKYMSHDYKDKLNTMTILVPKEYISGGLSEAIFKKHFTKVEFLSSDEIKKRIMENKNLDNCAEFFICQDPDKNSVFVMDLKTGDLISTAEKGKTSFNRAKKIDDESIEKLLEKLK
jgi:hypothetical protein